MLEKMYREGKMHIPYFHNITNISVGISNADNEEVPQSKLFGFHLVLRFVCIIELMNERMN